MLLSAAGLDPSAGNERHYETDSTDDSGSVAETRRETGCPEPFFREAKWCTRRRT